MNEANERDRKVEADEVHGLIERVTMKEVQEATKHIKLKKAPKLVS